MTLLLSPFHLYYELLEFKKRREREKERKDCVKITLIEMAESAKNKSILFERKIKPFAHNNFEAKIKFKVGSCGAPWSMLKNNYGSKVRILINESVPHVSYFNAH